MPAAIPMAAGINFLRPERCPEEIDEDGEDFCLAREELWTPERAPAAAAWLGRPQIERGFASALAHVNTLLGWVAANIRAGKNMRRFSGQEAI